MKKISEVLKIFRNSREMTASDLANILDCTNQFVSKLESGSRTLSIEKTKLLKAVMTEEEYRDLVEAVVLYKFKDLTDDFEFIVKEKEGLETAGVNKQKELNFGNRNKVEVQEEIQENSDIKKNIEIIESNSVEELEKAINERINSGRIIRDIKYQMADGIRSALIIYDFVVEKNVEE